MNLLFRVIWVEDMFEEGEKQRIADGIRSSGFEPYFEIDSDGSRIASLAKQNRLFNDFDFILLDLNLAGGVKGDDLAIRIRHLFRSIPILFYSSLPAEQLRQRMLQKNVEGVFCSHRQDMPARVAEMVADFSSALNRLAGMRGLAARVVAECDDEFRKIIIESSNRESSADALCSEIDELVAASQAKSKERYEACTDLEQRLVSRAVTSFHLWKVVQGITKLEKIAKPELSEMRVKLNSFNKSILEPRNSLSHVIEQKDDDGWLLVGTGGASDITVSSFSALRKEFITHLENIKSIRMRLSAT